MAKSFDPNEKLRVEYIIDEYADNEDEANENYILEIMDGLPDDQINYEMGTTILLSAAEFNHIKVAELALSYPNIYINYTNDYGWSALMLAVYNDNLEIVKLLLEHPTLEVDINMTSFEQGESALILALYPYKRDGKLLELSTEKIEIIKLLLNYPNCKLNINIQDNNGNTALIYAINRDLEIVKMLLSYPGIDVNIKNNYSETALIIVTKERNIEVIKLLLNHPDHKVITDIQDMYKKSALDIATDNDDIEIINLLKNYKVN